MAADRYTDAKIKDIKSKIKQSCIYIPNCLVRTDTEGPNKKLPEENEEITNTRTQTLLLSTMQVHLYFTMVLTTKPSEEMATHLICLNKHWVTSQMRQSLIFISITKK